MDRFVGIDVSKAMLDLACLPDGTTLSVPNDEGGVAELVGQVLALTPTLVVLEATGGFEHLVAAALAKAGLPLVVANPRQGARLASATSPKRSAGWPRPTRSTPRCSPSLPSGCARRRGRSPRPKPSCSEAELLDSLLTRRRQLVEMLTAKAAWPSAIGWASPAARCGAISRSTSAGSSGGSPTSTTTCARPSR
jgi:transposase